MSPFSSFLLAVFCSLAMSLIVIAGLWRPLLNLLVEVCGSASRAHFWRNYNAIVLQLVPVVCVMIGRTDERAIGEPFAFVDQFRWGVLGLILSLCMIGLVLVTTLPNPRNQIKLSGNARTDDIKRLLQKIEAADWEPGDMEHLIHTMDEIRARNVLKHPNTA